MLHDCVTYEIRNDVFSAKYLECLNFGNNSMFESFHELKIEMINITSISTMEVQ